VVLARHPANPGQALAWVAVDNPAALPGLGRKLPHYGKYSYLGFAGDTPDNILKGQWPVIASPLSVSLADGSSAALALPPRQSLAELPAAFSAERMMDDLRRLADPALEGRGLGSPGVDAAAKYIAERFRELGLKPGGDPGQGYFQTWETRSGDPPRTMTLRNLVGVIPGRDSKRSLVVGAHYDHLGRGWPDVRQGNAGEIHPGADDNASGMAVLPELARVLADGPPPPRSIVDADGMIRVAAVARETIEYLAGPEGRLTPSGHQDPASTEGMQTARRVALGTVLDFGYSGAGVRLSSVNPGSPAQLAGLGEGDILTEVNGRPVSSLREYAELLRALAPPATTPRGSIRPRGTRSSSLRYAPATWSCS